ncbi:MAG: PqqD family protein [Halobacteriota archaeon]
MRHAVKRASFCLSRQRSRLSQSQERLHQGLNSVGAHTWNIIQERRSVLQIHDTLLEEHDVHADRCERCQYCLVLTIL